MRGNIKSFEKPFAHAEVVALAERTLKRFGGDRNKAGRYARSMEQRYESAKWAQVVEVIVTSGRHHAAEKSPAQLDREIKEALRTQEQGRKFLVVCLNNDLDDTHAVEYDGRVGESLRDALDVAQPSKETPVSFAIVRAPNAETARLKLTRSWQSVPSVWLKGWHADPRTVFQ